MSFFMPLLGMCCLRRRFEEQFADCTGRTYIGDTGAFYFENIGAEDVRLFLLKQTYKSFLFIFETADVLGLTLFVGLAVFSKPSSQPIWLKA